VYIVCDKTVNLLSALLQGIQLDRARPSIHLGSLPFESPRHSVWYRRCSLSTWDEEGVVLQQSDSSQGSVEMC